MPPRVEVLREESQTERSSANAVYSYREVPGSEQLDLIEQLHANLGQLEDLHDRLRFVMAEVRGVLIKK